MKNFPVLLGAIMLFPALSQAQAPSVFWSGGGRESLSATLWANRSAEAQMICLQTYRAAMGALERALKDPNWSAAAEQSGNFATKKPAVILDLDETVLDNSPYQARLVKKDAGYSDAGWRGWVNEKAAPALPGSKAFLLFARARGVQIFYVSNRTTQEREATRENLKKLGMPLDSRAETLLFKGDRPGWGSDKTSRRAFVAQNHRVLLLIGDDLNDFVGAKTTLARREALTKKYASFWGQRWFLLPNAMYGSWEGAIVGFEDGISRQQALQRRLDAFRVR